MMHDLAKFLGEPLTLVALCAIGGGAMLMVVAWAFTGEYEKGGHKRQHERPRRTADIQPWMYDTSGNLIATHARHRREDMEGMTQNLAGYVRAVGAIGARARVATIHPDGKETPHARKEAEEHYSESEARVRVDAFEGDEQEEGGTDSERREDEGGTLAHGEEGRTYPEASGEVTPWRYIPSVDRYVLLDGNGDVTHTVDAASWKDERGRIAYALFRENVPMIPDAVPYYVVNEANIRGMYQ